MPDDERPLILTLGLEDSAFAWFNALRRAHFPPERNVLSAHLTLFHKLPGTELDAVLAEMRAAAAVTPALMLEVTGPWSLGRGVAYRLRSPQLDALRARLASAFAPWLTPQDRAGFRAHVTVQNKVEPAEARALLERLQAEFQPFNVRGEALLLWRYLDGPWEPLARASLSGES